MRQASEAQYINTFFFVSLKMILVDGDDARWHTET